MLTYHFVIKNPVTAFKHSIKKTFSPYFLWHRVLLLSVKKKIVSPCNTGVEMPVIEGYIYTLHTCVAKFRIVRVLVK